MMEQFQDMKEVIITVIDMAVFGRDQDEQDKHLCALLERFHTVVAKLNPEKLEMGLDPIIFTGHHITQKGIIFNPEKKIRSI